LRGRFLGRNSGVLGLDIPVTTLCDALGKVSEGENDLRIVVNVLDDMRGQGVIIVITAVSRFIGRLSNRTPGLKALLTSGPVADSGMALAGVHSIKIQYEKERKGLIALAYFSTLG
jgi:hypothetical protein